MLDFRRAVSMAATLTSLLVVGPLRADDMQPDALVKAMSQEVVAAVRSDRDLQAGDARKLAELAESLINPHLDFRRMTQSAMARNWRLATPEQQQRITLAFKTLLVGTYSRALVTYRDRSIEFRALRGDPQRGEVTVRSELLLNGKQPTVIDYDLANSAAGWRIFDIKVDGASLIVTYRDNFAEEVRNHGIEGLIASLDNRNLQNRGGGSSGPHGSGSAGK